MASEDQGLRTTLTFHDADQRRIPREAIEPASDEDGRLRSATARSRAALEDGEGHHREGHRGRLPGRNGLRRNDRLPPQFAEHPAVVTPLAPIYGLNDI